MDEMTAAFDPPERRGPIRYLHAFRSHWLLILGLTVLSVAAAALVTLTTAKKYEASTDMQIQALPAFGGDPFQGFDIFRQTADGASPTVTAARVFGSKQYEDALQRRLGRESNGVSVSITPLAQANIVTVQATAHNADLAAKAANTYAAIIVAQRKTLFQKQLNQKMGQVSTQVDAIPAANRAIYPQYAQLAGPLGTLKTWIGSRDPTVQILTAASVPSAASWPRPKLTLIVALL